jgi:hypothetical protein
LALFPPISLFRWVWETHVSLQGKWYTLAASNLPHCFLLSIELVFESNTFSKSEFSSYRKAHFVQRGGFGSIEDRHVSLLTIPSMLQTAAITTLFPCKNWLSFWKDYYWQLLSFTVEIVSVCFKQAFLAEMKKHMCILKKYHLRWKL